MSTSLIHLSSVPVILSPYYYVHNLCREVDVHYLLDTRQISPYNCRIKTTFVRNTVALKKPAIPVDRLKIQVLMDQIGKGLFHCAY